MKKLTFGKQGRSSAIAWILPALICLACLASCATPEHSLGTTPKAGTLAQQGYFIETPWPFRIQGVRFSPSLISGNGEVLLGSIRDGMVTWSAKAGFQPVAAFPPGYDLVVRNLSRDGSVATGVFIQNPPGSFRVTDFGIFRWPLDHRAELLSPHFLQSDRAMACTWTGRSKLAVTATRSGSSATTISERSIALLRAPNLNTGWRRFGPDKPALHWPILACPAASPTLHHSATVPCLWPGFSALATLV